MKRINIPYLVMWLIVILILLIWALSLTKGTIILKEKCERKGGEYQIAGARCYGIDEEGYKFYHCLDKEGEYSFKSRSVC